MILTLTPNPSLDRTVSLPGPLQRGTVQRLTGVVMEPGGKGVNVARVLVSAGQPAAAVLPAAAHDEVHRPRQLLARVVGGQLDVVADPLGAADEDQGVAPVPVDVHIFGV